MAITILQVPSISGFISNHTYSFPCYLSLVAVEQLLQLAPLLIDMNKVMDRTASEQPNSLDYLMTFL